MFNRFIDANYTSSAFSIGFGMLAVSYLKSNPFFIIGLIFLLIGMCSINEYSVKNIAQTLKLIYLTVIPVEIIIALYAYNNIGMSDFFRVTMVIALSNLIVILVLKRRLNILKKSENI